MQKYVNIEIFKLIATHFAQKNSFLDIWGHCEKQSIICIEKHQ